MTLSQAYVLFGIPALLLSLGVAAVVWSRIASNGSRRVPGE